MVRASVHSIILFITCCLFSHTLGGRVLRSLLKLSERDGPVIFGFLTFEHPKHMLKRIDKNYEHFYDHVFLRSYPFFFFFFFFFFFAIQIYD